MEDVVRALVDRMRALVAVYVKGGAAAFQHAFARAAIHVLSREITGERQRLEAVADSLPGLVGFVDMDARYQYINLAYETWLGRPRSFFLGKRIRDIAPPGAYEKIEKQVERA